MKRRRISIFLCLLCCFYPVVTLTGTADAAGTNKKPVLYETRYSEEEVIGVYYYTEGSEVQGRIPPRTVVELLKISGDWSKIKYKGGEYYVKTNKLEKVEAPNIVCSKWARDWLSYSGSYIGLADEWSGAKENYTKPITRLEMADILVGIMNGIYGSWCVQYTLPLAKESNGHGLLTDTSDFSANRLAYWGVVPEGKFRPNDTVTYQEMTKLLIKLMEYDQKYNREGGGYTFTKADIEKFNIGGKKDSKAKCTKEQAIILCDKARCWWEEMSYQIGAKYENRKGKGTTYVATGEIYTIQTCLGKEPNQPYLIINAEGKAELSSKKTQKYRVTYQKTCLDIWGEPMVVCTIKTMDGKYLATSGTPLNGSRLVIQEEEYLWCVIIGQFVEDQQVTYIVSPDNNYQVVNASGWNTEDGTPMITWNWNCGTGGDNNNAAFIFEKVKSK